MTEVGEIARNGPFGASTLLIHEQVLYALPRLPRCTVVVEYHARVPYPSAEARHITMLMCFRTSLTT